MQRRSVQFIGMVVLSLLTSNVSSAQSETIKDLDANHKVDIYTMPTLPSGGGKWFSPEYQIGPSHAPEGYIIEYSQFDLDSYHHCNANDFSPVNNEPGHFFSGHPTGNGYFSECWSEGRTPTAVAWRYRFQGLEHPERHARSSGFPIIAPPGTPLGPFVDAVRNLPTIYINPSPINIPGAGRIILIYRKISSLPNGTTMMTPDEVKRDLMAIGFQAN